MTLPKITIITPSYNQAGFLEETITSVLSQGYPNLEYMVFDGGSKDNSVEVIKKYQGRLSYWESQADHGQSHAINKGLERATGDIVNWLNSDDFYEPDSLMRVAEAFSEPTTQVVCGRSNIVDEQGNFIRISQGTDIYPGNLPKTMGWARIDQPETFFRKSVIDQMGFLNQDLRYVMDKDWWIRYLIQFGLEGIKQIDDRLVNFRIHDLSKTSTELDGFIHESNSLYRHMSEANHLENLKGVIDQIPCNADLNLDYQEFSFAEAVVNYFLLYKADEAYFLGQNAKTRELLNIIRPDLLSHEDLKLLEKLQFRAKYLPHWLRNVVKKIYA